MVRTSAVLRVLSLALVCLAAPAAAFAQTSSPFTPPEEKLGLYVQNSGGGLDTGCTFRSGGPLIIRFPIPATMHHDQVRADGTLANAGLLVGNGVIGAQAVLRMPVFDIDSSGGGQGVAPEVDAVTFNGVFKKTLTGINNTWTDDSIVLPIGELRFQSTNSPGVMNELRIDIDTANVGNGEFWCMAVDWVSVTFDAAAPYVLTHGIDAQATTWDQGTAPGVLTTLQQRGVLFERFSLVANGGSAGNAQMLQPLIENFLEPLKADVVHIIAHSKGGLDTQEMQALGPPFRILSLSTLSTPHRGSVAADLSIVQKTDADDKINTGRDPNGFASDYVDTWTFGQGPQRPGLDDLTTYRATAAIASGLRGNIARTFTFGANADLNGNNELEDGEAAGLFPATALTGYAARRAWRVLRDFSAAPILSITQRPGRLWGTRTVLTYQTIQAPTPQANDIVVTLASANPGYGTPVANVAANHGTVKSGANVSQILDRTIPLR
jgi:pimeloyl-ACP methyl ester carboxylesterase